MGAVAVGVEDEVVEDEVVEDEVVGGSDTKISF
jgi:hypothetical protein